MDSETVAIILCAGLGQRLGATDINKCVIPIGNTTPIQHTAKVLCDAGVDRLVIVTGFAASSVEEVIKRSEYTGKIDIIHNPYFYIHGCNYSLACAMKAESVKKAKRLIIAEGDSLLHKTNIENLIQKEYNAASLVRDVSYIDYSRSVMAIGDGKYINRYVYNQEHTPAYPSLFMGERIIGDSMQLWLFSGNVLKKFMGLVIEYGFWVENDKIAHTDSGIYSINMLGCEISPIKAELPDAWINLNTKTDLERARGMEWLLK